MKMLRTARKSKGLTMKGLGEKVGVSESAISQYETGKREADFETILKIGEVLDCSIDYLFRGAEKKKSPPPHGWRRVERDAAADYGVCRSDVCAGAGGVSCLAASIARARLSASICCTRVKL